MVGARIVRLIVATMLNRAPSAEPLHLQIANAWAPDNKHAAGSDPPRAGAAGRSRTECLDLHRALRGLDRAQSL